MDVLVLRLLLDASFFMSVFNPLISGSNVVFKFGLTTILGAWLVWIAINWKKKDLAGRVQDIAFGQLKILAVVHVYEVAMLGLTRWQEVCGTYLACFVVIMILFLRAGRLTGAHQEKKRFWGANSLEMLVVLVVALVMSSQVVRSAAWGMIGGFYKVMILPVLMLIINVMQMVLMLLEPLIAALFDNVEFENHEVEVDNRTAMDFLDLTGTEGMGEAPLWSKILGIAIVAVVLAIVFYFLFKKFSVEGSGRNRDIRGEVKKSTLGAGERPVSKKRSFFEEKSVRYYYRKFLDLCRKNGMQPETLQVTTEMMQQIAEERWGDEANVGELTELYREVRYGGRQDEEPERKTAKELFRNVKNVAAGR